MQNSSKTHKYFAEICQECVILYLCLLKCAPLGRCVYDVFYPIVFLLPKITRPLQETNPIYKKEGLLEYCFIDDKWKPEGQSFLQAFAHISCVSAFEDNW